MLPWTLTRCWPCAMQKDLDIQGQSYKLDFSLPLSAEDQHDDAFRAQITTYDANLKEALKDWFEPIESNNEFDL